MFIETKDGNLINSADIREVVLEPNAGTSGKYRYYAIRRKGDRHEISRGEANRLQCEGALLPARPGDMALVLDRITDGSKADCLEELPIVGWRLVWANGDKTTAAPVLPGDLYDYRTVGVLLPDGRVLVGHEAIYANREEFLASCVKSFAGIKRRKREKVAA